LADGRVITPSNIKIQMMIKVAVHLHVLMLDLRD
jgi:hypothetical protein